MTKIWNIRAEEQMQISVHYSREVIRFADMMCNGKLVFGLATKTKRLSVNCSILEQNKESNNDGRYGKDVSLRNTDYHYGAFSFLYQLEKGTLPK